MIRLLHPQEIAQIAAGEVIIDTCSVLKELIENSIDAKAKNITIRLTNYGCELIEVQDDGIGMTEKDLRLCTTRHATSKFIDIHSINFLGFRGEALYAIEQVSNLKIVSNQICYENDNIIPIASNLGTTVSVKNLFYNVPARRKRLITYKKEQKIDALIESYVIANSDIQFTFYNNGRKKIYHSKNALQTIFGNFYDNKIDFFANTKGYKISGSIFIGLRHKYFIVLNGRVLKDRKLTNIVRETYQAISGYNSVAFILFIECDINAYDVNIHPSKYEVMFIDQEVFNIIEQSIRNSCGNWQISYEESKVDLPDTWLLNEHDEIQKTWVVANRYIYYLYNKKVCIVDQHAAHERILSHELEKHMNIKQQLLHPYEYKLNPEQISLWNEENREINCLFNFKLHGNKLTLYSIPSMLNLESVYDIVHNSRSNNDVRSIINDILHEKGCHNAIRSGDILAFEDHVQLMQKLYATPNYRFCNHGRPTILIFTLQQLNTMFHR